MKFVSERLYKITTHGCLALFGIYLLLCSDIVRADTGSDMTQTATICAASNAVISQQSGSELIREEAQWWNTLLKELSGETAAELAVMISLKNIQAEYNSGKMSWDRLIDVGRVCNDIRHDIESVK